MKNGAFNCRQEPVIKGFFDIFYWKKDLYESCFTDNKESSTIELYYSYERKGGEMYETNY